MEITKEIAEFLLFLESNSKDRRGFSKCHITDVLLTVVRDEYSFEEFVKKVVDPLNEGKFIMCTKESIVIDPYCDNVSGDIFLNKLFYYFRNNKNKAVELANTFELAEFSNLVINKGITISETVNLLNKLEELGAGGYQRNFLFHNLLLRVKLKEKGKRFIADHRNLINKITSLDNKYPKHRAYDAEEHQLEFDEETGVMKISHHPNHIKFRLGSKGYDLIKYLWRNTNTIISYSKLQEVCGDTGGEISIGKIKARLREIDSRIEKELHITDVIDIKVDGVKVAPD